MTSSISHDLRHQLTAILANAEFLSEGQLHGGAWEDLYEEIRSAVNRMIELIDSLLEFSRGRESLQLSRGNVNDIVARVVQEVQVHPEFSSVTNDLKGQCSESWFDQRRLERAFYNLLLNACEAAATSSDGQVEICIEEVDGTARILISDNGHGIPEPIRGRLFQPFVSFGKKYGIGLGLTIAQKVKDHGGYLRVASTAPAGTSFELMLPMNQHMVATSLVHTTLTSDSPLVQRDE